MPYTGSQKYGLLKVVTKENLLAIDCKHVLRAVSVLTFGSFTLYNYNFTIVSFLDVSKRLFNEVFESIIPVDMSLLNNYDTNYIVFFMTIFVRSIFFETPKIRTYKSGFFNSYIYIFSVKPVYMEWRKYLQKVRKNKKVI